MYQVCRQCKKNHAKKTHNQAPRTALEGAEVCRGVGGEGRGVGDGPAARRAVEGRAHLCRRMVREGSKRGTGMWLLGNHVGNIFFLEIETALFYESKYCEEGQGPGTGRMLRRRLTCSTTARGWRCRRPGTGARPRNQAPRIRNRAYHRDGPRSVTGGEKITTAGSYVLCCCLHHWESYPGNLF